MLFAKHGLLLNDEELAKIEGMLSLLESFKLGFN